MDHHAAEIAAYQRRKQAWLDWQAVPDGAARASWLRQLAQDDPALAADLEAQIAASAAPLPLLDGCRSAVRPEATRPALGQYRFVRELGRGGMGRVWLAERQLGDATQQVALKQIVHAQWDADDRRRFERERRILARLNHPLIAGLVDGGSDAEGAPFLATTFVDGERIDRHVARIAPPLVERVALVEQLAQAVAYAHRQLVVHRDLKPANILIDRAGTPRLLDFGVARLLAEEAITATGASQLTLRYAAPEQLSDIALTEGAGVGCDIHALGLLLFELACGESPWAAVGTDPQALIAAILNQVPARLSTRTTLAGANADLDAIVAKALRKRIEDRYPSADALAEDLGRWRRREPVLARRGERGYRWRATLRRHWPWLTAATAALAVAVTSTGYHLRTLDTQLAATGRERDRAQALATYFGDLFRNTNPAAADRGIVSASDLLESSVEHLHRDTKRTPETRATLLLAAADALSHLGRSAPAHVALERAAALLESAPDSDPLQRAKVHSELAGHYHREGHADAAMRELSRAREFLARAAVAQTADLALTITQQEAMIAEDRGDRAGAQAIYARIIEMTRPQLAADPEQLRSHLAAHTNIAITELGENRPELAETRLRDALATAEALAYADLGQLLPMRAYYARSLYDQRKLDAARTVMEPTLDAAREWYGKNEPWLGLILAHAATEAMLGGRPELATVLYDDAARRARENYPQDHPVHWAIRGDRALGLVLAGPKRFDEARRELEAALAWRESRGSGDSPAAQFDRLALAWLRCAANPDDAAARAEVRERHTAGRVVFKAWKRWVAEDWVQGCAPAT